jgi:uncharacterized protein (DUF362 family)
MSDKTVSIIKYKNPYNSVKKSIDLCNGFEHLPFQAKVFIKPNVVWWTTEAVIPKWGVITTSRVVEDIVVILKEYGIKDITIGEGMVTHPSDTINPAAAFEGLGYKKLEKSYGVKCLNVHERPFDEFDLGLDNTIKFNVDILESDFLVDLPVLKTHFQAIVSLGIKNLKGLIDVESRKICHKSDSGNDLHRYVSKLIKVIPPSLTLIDGIYSNEIGPAYSGNLRRTNLLIASSDMLSADMVGASVLGHEPSSVPHLSYAAEDIDRPTDLSDIQVVGESIEDVKDPHLNTIPWDEEKKLPIALADMGVSGIMMSKIDLSMCTYCAAFYPPLLKFLALSWTGEPWDDVEILAGKERNPTPGRKKTILFGKCMYQDHKDNPDIQEMIPIKGCPPTFDSVHKAFKMAGIELSPLYGDLGASMAFLMNMYKEQPDFEEHFYTIQQ